jgi:hypothetical protein
VEELGPAAMVGDARKLGVRWGEPSSSSPTPGGEAPAATTGGARGGSGGAPGGGDPVATISCMNLQHWKVSWKKSSERAYRIDGVVFPMRTVA